MLFLLGDYIHGGGYDYEVLDKIMGLQASFGTDKVVALLGNHEEFVLLGDSTISSIISDPFISSNKRPSKSSKQ